MAFVQGVGIVDTATSLSRAGATGSDVVIAERGGRRRVFRLSKEARPTQGLEVERFTAQSVTRSQGSIDATVQKFYPGWAPIVLRGQWRTVWLGRGLLTVEEGGARTTLSNTRDAEAAFNSLWVEGQDCDFRWETQTFRVSIERFKTRWIRVEDADWELALTVIGPGSTAPPNEYASEFDVITSTGTLYAQVSGWLSTAKAAIAGIAAYERAANSHLDRIARLNTELSTVVSSAADVATAPARIAGRVEATCRSIASAWGAAVTAVNAVGAAYASDGSTVGRARVDAAQASFTGTARAGAAGAFLLARAARRSTGSTIARVVTASAETDLRRLAAQYLGDASAWQEIAKASGLSAPKPPVGSTILIPRRNP